MTQIEKSSGSSDERRMELTPPVRRGAPESGRGRSRPELVTACFVLLLLSATVISGCERRELRTPAGGARLGITRDGLLPATNPYAGDAMAIADGRRLYQWLNCAGCHAYGGGGIGSPFMDSAWVYGGSPPEIFASISQGRPNGMPAYGMRVPASEIWKLVAYVQELEKAPGDSDHRSRSMVELRRRSPEHRKDASEVARRFAEEAEKRREWRE
jgi:mono/diheme cytochrome c family protein